MGEGEVRQRKKKSQHSSSQSVQQKTSHKGDGKSKTVKQSKDYQAALAMLHDMNDESVGNKFFTRGKPSFLNLET